MYIYLVPSKNICRFKHTSSNPQPPGAVKISSAYDGETVTI